MTRTLYIAGPMSNIPQFNFPLFEAVAVALRDDGYTIVSPHECDGEDTRRMAWASPDGAHTGGGESWGTCLARDVKMLADGYERLESDAELRSRMTAAPRIEGSTLEFQRDIVISKIDGIAFLPNWDKSKGARLEAFVGLLTGKEFYTVSPDGHGDTAGLTLEVVTTEWVQHMLAAPWAEGIRMHTPLPRRSHYMPADTLALNGDDPV